MQTYKILDRNMIYDGDKFVALVRVGDADDICKTVNELRESISKVSECLENVTSLYEESENEPCTCGSDESNCRHCSKAISAYQRVWAAQAICEKALLIEI